MCKTKMDMRSFEIGYVNINEFRKTIDAQVDKICKEFPEVDPNEIYVMGESGVVCMGDYDQDITVLIFKFKRNLTERELEMEQFQKEQLKKRSIENMRKLINDNIDEAREYLKELDEAREHFKKLELEISHKPKTKIDCADSLKGMFVDE